LIYNLKLDHSGLFCWVVHSFQLYEPHCKL